jgi:hypothetical protein
MSCQQIALPTPSISSAVLRGCMSPLARTCRTGMSALRPLSGAKPDMTRIAQSDPVESEPGTLEHIPPQPR